MNSQYFSSEQIKSGEMQSFIQTLMNEAYGKGHHYNDIHIRPADCGDFIVEWVQLPWSHEYGGTGFVYCDEEHELMIQRTYPDGSYDYFYSEEDYQDSLKYWLENNPGWAQNQFGRWYNEKDNEELKKSLGLGDKNEN